MKSSTKLYFPFGHLTFFRAPVCTFIPHLF